MNKLALTTLTLALTACGPDLSRVNATACSTWTYPGHPDKREQLEWFTAYLKAASTAAGAEWVSRRDKNTIYNELHLYCGQYPTGTTADAADSIIRFHIASLAAPK